MRYAALCCLLAIALLGCSSATGAAPTKSAGTIAPSASPVTSGLALTAIHACLLLTLADVQTVSELSGPLHPGTANEASQAGSVWGTQIRRDDQLAVPDVASRKVGPMVAGPDSQAALGKQLDVHRIHAATGNGVREYSRRSPPSLSSHVTGPDIRIGSERAIGVCRSSPRCGRARL